MKQSANTRSIVITAFFAAVIFLGIQSFRIPMPAAVGTPFLHFGHIFIMMAVVCLGPKRSAIAGILGLVIFDILNGYMHSIPNVFVNTLIKCLLVGAIFVMLKKKAAGDSKKEYAFAILSAVIYGITSTVVDFVWSTMELVIMGSTLSAAITAELTAIPATAINGVFTVIGVAILYIPVTAAYKRISKE